MELGNKMRTGTRFGLIIGTGIALTSLIGCSNETTATRNQSADSVAVADSSKKYSFADIPFVKDEIKEIKDSIIAKK